MLNNTKGYTSTSGLATEFVISGAPTNARAITAVMTDGMVKTFYITIGSNYMLFKGRYVASPTTKLVIESILNSSNSNTTVNWPAGLKIIACVASVEDLTDMEQMLPGATKKIFTAAQETRVNGLNAEFDEKADLTDPRFAMTDVNAMTPSVLVAGTEKVPASTVAGDPISLTPDLIMGDPLRHAMGHGINRRKGFSDFSKMTALTMLNGDVVGLEPYTIFATGDNAKASQGNLGVYFQKCLELETGTQALGGCVVQHLDNPIIYFGQDFDERWSVQIPVAPVSGHDFAVMVGFGELMLGNFARGIWLERRFASPNWQIMIRNTAGLYQLDTGIAALTGAKVTVRVKHESVEARCRFWVNGVETPQVLDSTKTLDLFTFLTMAAGIYGVTGLNQSKKLAVFAHKYNNGTPPGLTLEHFA
jgi:hypothetical protein